MIKVNSSKEMNFWIATISLAILAYFLQSMWFLNGDVGSLLYDTRLFLNGGTYVKDFLETNPPMIFFIYAPVCLINSLTSWHIIVIVRIYVILLALLSIFLSSVLLEKVIKNDDAFLRLSILSVVAFVFLFLPICEFAQREHFFLILSMPYVFSAVRRADNIPTNKFLACLVGLLAGIGIGMKPYFLAPLILIECYLVFLKQHIFSWVRYEAMTCALVLVIYLISVIWFYPEYFHVMMPLISHLYYISIKQPWIIFFSRLPVIFCFFVMGYGLIICFKPSRYRTLIQIIEVTLIGMIIAFVIPRAAWYYHIFPAIGIASIMVVLALYQFFSSGFEERMMSKRNIGIVMSLTMIMPFYFFLVGTRYSYYVKQNSDLNPLIAFINATFDKPSIYCFSSNTTGDCFTLVYLTKSTYAGRYPFFWWMKGLNKLEREGTLTDLVQRDKQFLIEAIADDLNRYKANLLIINTYDAKMTHGEFFNFGKYFSQNKKFANAWQHYQYFATIGVFELYHRGV